MHPQLSLNLAFRTDYRREQFVVTSSNVEAFSWIDRWPQWPHSCLALYGEEASGKTHLAHIWQMRAQAHWVRPDDITSDPDQLLARASAFVFDGIQAPETWLFHFYNLLAASYTTILFCHTLPPKQWPISLADLQSRLATIPAIGIKAPDADILTSLLKKLFRERGVLITPEVTAYLLNRVERSYPAIYALVHHIDEFCLSENKRMSLPLIRTYLAQSRPL